MIDKDRLENVLRHTFLDYRQASEFLERPVVFEKAKGLNMRTMHSITGSTADYMEDQEFGAIKTKRGSEAEDRPEHGVENRHHQDPDGGLRFRRHLMF